MTIIHTLEKHYFSLIKNNIQINIFNQVPDDTPYPFIKLGTFSLKPWLRMANSWIVEMTIDCYSDFTSNIEALNIFGEVSKLLRNQSTRIDNYHLVKQQIDELNISQTSNNIWHWELNLTLWTVEYKS